MAQFNMTGMPSNPFWEIQHVWERGEYSIDEICGMPARLITRELVSDERIFGGGQSFLGVDLRGKQRVLVNRETNGASGIDAAYLNVPFFHSDRGWGLLIETGAPVLADLGASDPQLAKFLILDPSATVVDFAGSAVEILEQYMHHTGSVGDWPDWAFGVWMSRATYLSANEMLEAVAELRAADCPVDVIHVDAWMTGNVYREFTTNWEVDRRRFPEGWTQALRAAGARVSMWLNPYILSGSRLAADLGQRGILVQRQDGSLALTSDRDTRHLIDFTNPDARAWWADAIATLLAQESPDALKLDFAEEFPADAIASDGTAGMLIRNSYATAYQQATAAAIPADLMPLPLFNRSGSTGAQRNPCHWVGDTPATWSAMAGALSACLSLSLSGFPLVTHDAGGFHSPGTSDIPVILLDGGQAQYTADVDPELFARWVQWAAFSPVTRLHGLGKREPTAYPQPWRSAAITALRMRPAILSDLRAALHQAQATGIPIMRPTCLTHPHEPAARGAVAQYLLGSDLLVAPIMAPGGHVRMWFPPGNWAPILGAPHVAPDDQYGWAQVQCGPSDFPVFRRTQ